MRAGWLGVVFVAAMTFGCSRATESDKGTDGAADQDGGSGTAGAAGGGGNAGSTGGTGGGADEQGGGSGGAGIGGEGGSAGGIGGEGGAAGGTSGEGEGDGGDDICKLPIETYHYLGYTQPVGEHLKYLVYAQGQPVACFAWSSAPRHHVAKMIIPTSPIDR